MMIERAGVGGRIRARRAADRRLIDHDQLVELGRAFDRAVGAAGGLIVQMLVERSHEHLVDQRRLAAAAHARDGGENADRKATSTPLDVVRRCFAHFEPAARLAPGLRDRDELASRKVRAGLGLRIGDDVVERADGENLAALGAGARPDVDDDVGGAHRILVVLDHDQRVAEIAQRLAASPAAGRCRADASPIDGSSKM